MFTTTGTAPAAFSVVHTSVEDTAVDVSVNLGEVLVVFDSDMTGVTIELMGTPLGVFYSQGGAFFFFFWAERLDGVRCLLTLCRTPPFSNLMWQISSFRWWGPMLFW